MTVFYEICYATDEEIKKAVLLSDIKGEVVGTVAALNQATQVIERLGSAFFYRRVETEEPNEIIRRVQTILKQIDVMRKMKERDYSGA